MRVIRLILIFLAGLTVLAEAAPANLSLRLLVDNPRPYVGEEFILSLEFGYDQLPLNSPQVIWSGQDSFITTDLSPLLPRRERHNSQQRMIETARKLLKPISTERAEFTVTLRTNDGLVASPPLTIRPRPLPNLNRPEHFSGAVIKDAKLEVSAEGNGEREVVVTFSGRGDLTGVELTPLLQSGDQLVQLSDKLLGQTGREQSRQVRYLYQPGSADRWPGFTTTSFDPVSAKYQTLSSQPSTATGLRLIMVVILLLICVAFIITLKRRHRSNLGSLLTDILGCHPQGLTHEQYGEKLYELQFSPDLIDALLREHHSGDECFAPGRKMKPEQPSSSRAELARRLRSELVDCLVNRDV